MIWRFLRDERGTTALEYAVIGGLISVAILAAMAPIGDQVSEAFQSAADGFAQP